MEEKKWMKRNENEEEERGPRASIHVDWWTTRPTVDDTGLTWLKKKKTYTLVFNKSHFTAKHSFRTAENDENDEHSQQPEAPLGATLSKLI